MRKTKVVCTLGPSTDTPEMIEQLILAGMDVARLNFSHGTHEEHGRRIEILRKKAEELGVHVAVMLDTKGPEIRTGRLRKEKVELKTGQEFILTTREILGDENQVQVSYEKLPQEVKPKDKILLADGYIILEVVRVEGPDIVCQVVFGGELGERKGLNIPGVRTSLPFLSQADIDDISFGLECGIDFVAASFVRTAEDVLAIRRVVESKGKDVDIIAKIESQEGINNLDDIIRVADGIMVARGDLGVEIPTEEVPLVQKQIVQKCNMAGKPVIIATQMLESMINNPRPTRAEASDVANAILDGADAVMLSEETAAGRFPKEALETMVRIAARAEEALAYDEMLNRKKIYGNSVSVTDAIGYATCSIAADLKVAAVVTATQSGSTGRMVAKYRPRCPIVAATPSLQVARKLKLVWGIQPIVVERTYGTDEMIERSVNGARRAGLIQEGDLVVITAGVPTGVPGTTNLLKVHLVAEVLVKGQGVGGGFVTGRVKVIRHPQEGTSFSEGDILVTVSTDREFMPIIEKASAIIVEESGLTSHAAIVGLSLKIPVIVGAQKATAILKDQMLVTVDSVRGQVYRGAAKAL